MNAELEHVPRLIFRRENWPESTEAPSETICKGSVKSTTARNASVEFWLSKKPGRQGKMRKCKVPKEQISIFLGHLPKDSDATTSIYAPYEPEYCSEAIAAIESVMAEIRKHLTRANINQPVIDAATLAKSMSSKPNVVSAMRSERKCDS